MPEDVLAAPGALDAGMRDVDAPDDRSGRASGKADEDVDEWYSF